MKNNILNKCKKIKIVLTDVDGVLTDGGMYYTDKGDIIKKFFVRDGMGVTLLRKKNIPTIIVTKEKTKIVREWAKRMKIEKVFGGVIQKELILDKIYEKYNVTPSQIAYIGDDVNDVELLKKVGLSLAPLDCVNEVKKEVDYICKRNSGQGAFRELADMIVNVK
ncbi:MAG: HAD-IIIA family hydrolase [Nitrosopumilus sp.]|nr:HAD-IIIA family hydrolase [Nitrosopumilus sp.]